MKRKKIAVLGFMANCPIAGVIWQHLHYIIGLQRLGHEVYYIEDTSRIPYDPVQQTLTEDYSYAAHILGKLAAEHGFVGRWAFSPRYKSRDETAGLGRTFLNELYSDADALLNICGSHELNDDLLRSERIVYVESDPAVEQIKVDQGDAATTAFLARHCARFTFGENVGRPEFPVPLHGLTWLPTRQPVVCDLWNRPTRPMAADARYTSIANLATGGKKDIAWRGENYLWSKLPEFLRYRLVPQRCAEDFELATHFADRTLGDGFQEAGWRIVPPDEISVDHHRYVEYIGGSKGEFTVAKDQYVRLHTGWFSDRSACYLAAGRPVVTQQTGFTRLYGGDAGLFAFETVEDIVEAVGRINSDYARHCQAAREIAREFFEAETVLRSMLDRVGI